MNKNEIYTKLKSEKVVAVIRDDDYNKIPKIVDAIYKGGIKFMEITFTIPYANEVISELSKKYKGNNDIVIGAGTVLDEITARIAILSGAKFIVCPHFDENIVKLCNLYGISVFTGATTVLDIKKSLEAGVEVVKLFPSNTYGSEIIKAFKGPLPNAEFMPTGGINKDNIVKWLNAGAFAVGTGSMLKGAKNNDFESIELETKKIVDEVKNI